jgi:hypothetical protein
MANIGKELHEIAAARPHIAVVDLAEEARG